MKSDKKGSDALGEDAKRVVFLDYLRVIACFMVILVHACEQFYFNAEGSFSMATQASGAWAVFVDSFCRAAVPLFVMASAYLLFPVTRPTGEFFRRRLVRVFVPFALYACAYNWWFGGKWTSLLFNFPAATGGHLWFVPMLLGLYLLMPLLSPWAEKASEKEVRGWLILWLVTTTFPYLRRLSASLLGAPLYGAVPFLYGECPWNSFGAFQYVSGFFGYLLLGFWFRRFAPALSLRRTLLWALPTGIAGYAIVSLGFWLRIPFDGAWPFTRPYSFAVDVEMSWEFCSLGVAMMTMAYFLLIRRFTSEGVFYRRVVRPLSEASYGTYLVHIFFLVLVMPILKPSVPTPVAIFGAAVLTFVGSSFFSILLRRLPVLGRWM